MRKHSLIIILLTTMLLGACAGDAAQEATATNTPEPTPASPTSPPPTPEPTATEDLFALVEPYLGEWSGEWRNTTFGSSGAVRATLEAQPDGTASFTVDLDGFVFGALDPDPKTYTGSYTADGATFEAPGDPLFGDLTIQASFDGQVTITGEMVPVPGIAQLDAVGSFTPQEIALEYTVTFAGGDLAEGEMTLTKTP